MVPSAQQKYFDSLQSFALSLPLAEEMITWDHPTWRIFNKMFAICSNEEDGLKVSLKTTPDRKPILEQDPAIEPAPYLSAKGWVQITITDQSTLAMTKELLKESHHIITQTLPKSKQSQILQATDTAP